MKNKNYGYLIKKIRLEKGLCQKAIYEGIMSRQAYYLIESDNSLPTFDKFIAILDRLFVTLEEFLSLLDSQFFYSESTLYQQLNQAIMEHNRPLIEKIHQTAALIYQKSQSTKFHHLALLSEALLTLGSGHPSPLKIKQASKLMLPIKEYLLGIDTWYLYELKLLNNALFCFELTESVALVNLVTLKLNNQLHDTKHQEIKIKIYLNLSYLCLKSHKLPLVMHYAASAKATAEKFNFIFETIIASLNYEIAILAKQNLKKNQRLDFYLSLLKQFNYRALYSEYQELMADFQLL